MQEIDPLREACRRRRVPVTTQRRVVYELLAAREDHPTADAVYAAVRRRMPGMSRATVYRILSAFVEWGLAGRVFSKRRGARFDGNALPHHHFLCTHCDRVADCGPAGVRVTLPSLSRGYRVRGFSVVFRGLCPDCSRKER